MEGGGRIKFVFFDIALVFFVFLNILCYKFILTTFYQQPQKKGTET
jgi:hypothetical protein